MKGGVEYARTGWNRPIGIWSHDGTRCRFLHGYAVPWGARYYGRGVGLGFGRGFRRMYYATGLTRWARFSYPGYPQYSNPVYMGNEDIAESEKELLSRQLGYLEGEKEFLGKQAEYLEKELEQVKKRLAKFEDNDK